MQTMIELSCGYRNHATPRRRRRRAWRGLVRLLRRLLTLTVLLLAIAYVQTVSAGEAYESLEGIGRGTLVYTAQGVAAYQAATLLDTQVDMRITGMLLRAEVRQSFSNPTGQWQEGIYVFPLPENAAVDRLRMRVGERVIEGQIKERARARAVYTRARRSGKAAGLVEQERPNMFTTSVANIPPQSEIIVRIEYQQTLRYDQGTFRLRFPLAITPRYMPGEAQEDGPTGAGWSPPTDEVADASRISPPFIFNTPEKINPVRLRIELDAGVPLDGLTSPTHAIDTREHGSGRVTVSLRGAGNLADRDFVLHWQPRHDDAPRTALFRERFEGQDYHLLMLLPPLPAAIRSPLGRDVVFVIDTSGSMGGVSIRQARAALSDALSRLSSADRFNIIQFNSSPRALFDEVRPASAMNIARARDYVTGLSAGGGTEMRPALQRALRNGAASRGNLRQIIFLTDGSVGNERALFRLIHERLGRSRLYTVGIGSAPNSYFMRKAAEFGKGTYTYIDSTHQVGARMSELFAKLAYPVLQDIQVSLDGHEALQVWPRPVPDAYAGEPLMLTFRVPSSEGELILRAKRGARDWQQSVDLAGAQPGRGIAALWARRRIGSLMDRVHAGEAEAAIRRAVTRLALKHHLVSKFTSLVAVDVTALRRSDTPLQRNAVPVNLPHGQQAGNFIAPRAQTASPMYLLLAAGSLVLVLAAIAFATAARRGERTDAC